MTRGQFFKYVTTNLAGERLAERDLPPRIAAGLLAQHERAILSFAEGEFEGIGNTAALVGRSEQAVNDEFYFQFLSTRRHQVWLIQVFDHACNSHPLKSTLAQSR